MRTVRAQYGEIISMFDSVSSIANEFLSFIMDGYDIFDYVEAYEKIDVSDVNNALHGLFDEKYYTLATIVPQDE